MTGKMQWSRQQSRGRRYEQAVPRAQPSAGPWTHIKREPVRSLSKDEIAALLKQRPDLQGDTRSRARGTAPESETPVQSPRVRAREGDRSSAEPPFTTPATESTDHDH